MYILTPFGKITWRIPYFLVVLHLNSQFTDITHVMTDTYDSSKNEHGFDNAFYFKRQNNLKPKTCGKDDSRILVTQIVSDVGGDGFKSVDK